MEDNPRQPSPGRPWRQGVQGDKTVKALKDKLFGLGPMLPGSISRQWNVCGIKGCRCKDPVRPQKHGPYYQLSFTIAGKSSTMFLKKADIPQVRQRIKNYQMFKALNTRLIQAYIGMVRKYGMGVNRP